MNLNSITIKDISTQLSKFLHRYHVILFVVVTLGGLAFSTFMLNNILSSSSVVTTDTSVPSFDQATIDKILSFKTSSQQHGQFTPPAGRSNPFAE